MARFRRSRPTHLVSLDDVTPSLEGVDQLGGMAQGLLDARRRGVRVLGSWVLPAEAFRAVVRESLPPSHDPASLLRIIHRPAGVERAARARDRLLSVPLPEPLGSELATFWESVGHQARWGLVVRASPTVTDDSIAEGAGLFMRMLGVRELGELERAIRTVWSLGVQEDSLCYLREHKVRDLAMAVVLQPLGKIQASGLLFPRDPTQARLARSSGTAFGQSAVGPSEQPRVALCALGLGSPVLDGAAALDVLRFRDAGSVEERAAPKHQKLVVSASGLEYVPVDAPRARRLALPAAAVDELEVFATRLGESYANRQIEFVWARSTGVHIAELRALGGHGYPVGGGPKTVWSRAGVGESLAGIPSPLTWSLARAFEEKGLRRALEQLGSEVARGAPLVRLVHGRLYFNLSLVVPALSEVPGIDPLTLLEFVRREAQEVMVSELDLGRRAGSLPRLSLTAARLGSLGRKLADDVARFERDAEQQRRWLAEMDLGILPDDALKTTLLETHQFFQATGRVLLGCTLGALAAHVGLKTVLARATPVEAERLVQLVTGGAGQLESIEPGLALAQVAAIVDKDPAARAALSAGAAFAEIEAGPGRRAISQFLDAYGDRALREAELMTPRFSEQPEPVLRMIAGLMSGTLDDPERRLSHARVRADRELAALEPRLSYVERTLVRALIGRVRELTRLRERMRIWMARTLSMLRTVALDVDRRLRRLDRTLDEGSAFFCTFAELVSAVGSYRVDLGPVVRQRRAAYLRDIARLDPPDTFVGVPAPLDVPPLGLSVLHGAAGSAGVATGPARIVDARGRGAERVRPGDVLVFRTLDVGLSPLFPAAAALVADLGGPLSHGAVVAREYGIPAVLGVIAASSTLADGERLRVDGERGVVERLDV
jgi:pyruvate,water dikinase